MEPEPRPLTLADISTACRQLSNQKLGELAVKIEPHADGSILCCLRKRCCSYRRSAIRSDTITAFTAPWGFGAKLSHGKGLGVLFSGPPGTGKTLAAEVVANDVGSECLQGRSVECG